MGKGTANEGMRTKTATEAERMKFELKQLRDKRAIALFILSIVISLSLYGGIGYLVINETESGRAAAWMQEQLGMDKALAENISNLGEVAVLAFIVIIIICIIYRNKSEEGKAAAYDLRVTPKVNQEVFDAARMYSQKLGLKHPPEVFVTERKVEKTLLNAEVHGDRVIHLDAIIWNNAVRANDMLPIRFRVASAISHVYLRHSSLWFQVLSFPARCLPIYNGLYKRAMTYAADRIVLFLMGREDAARGLFSTLYNTKLYDMEHVSAEIHQKFSRTSKQEQRSMALANLLTKSPLPPYRLYAMLEQEKR